MEGRALRGSCLPCLFFRAWGHADLGAGLVLLGAAVPLISRFVFHCIIVVQLCM